MTRKELVEKLNKRMKTLSKNISVVDDGDLTLQYDGLDQAWFQCFIPFEFKIISIDYLSSYVKHSEALVQFYVQGQKLLEKLDE